jgi:hypothetical protein
VSTNLLKPNWSKIFTYQAENGVLAFENGVLVFENGASWLLKTELWHLKTEFWHAGTEEICLSYVSFCQN